ncbi:MAG: phosphoenolpyruvate synthase [Rubrobacteridae bacterium]|nr:phosphoenolpyruvate synthase [Rubrobacteridae bacterium]
MDNVMKYIVQFKDVGKDDIALAGGKGANLGEMTRAGLPVPPGFIVTAPAYFDFLESAKLKDNIERILLSIDYDDNWILDKASDAIEHLINSAEMPEDIANEIKQAYQELVNVTGTGTGDATIKPVPGAVSRKAVGVTTRTVEEITDRQNAEEDIYVAVRSSATAEDLPKASFAGQQVTFLNVKGADNVVDAVKHAWASLFEARAIFYRHDKGFDHFKVGIAIPVQKMIESEKSGIMFTVEPLTNNVDQIDIEAAYGLGEAVVSGDLTPDSYIVNKSNLSIIERRIAEQSWKIELKDGNNQHSIIPQNMRKTQKLTDDEIKALAQYGLTVEKHYGFPQDVEWAIEGGRIYLVQTRPVTPEALIDEELTSEEPLQAESQGQPYAETISEVQMEKPVEKPQAPVEPQIPEIPKAAESQAPGEVILEGIAASTGIASGVVKIVHSKDELGKVVKGDVLVAPMTNPDFVPAMRKVVAIVTDAGGRTSHAAIVSREIGIPSIVGTGKATQSLKDGSVITVDGARGIIYSGEVMAKPLLEKRAEAAATVSGGVQVAEREIGEAQEGLRIESETKEPLGLPVTATKLYINLAEPDLALKYASLPVDGVGLLRAEFMMAGIGKHPRAFIDEGKQQEFIDELADGLREFAQAFYPRPVIYRTSDFKTNEYRELSGGDKYEMPENNPMIGYRGVSRYVKERDEFEMELSAIKKVRNKWGLKNLWVMLPFVRKVSEVEEIKKIMQENGLKRSTDFKLWLMIEVPSTVFLIEDFCKTGIDGVSIGSNDLTQLILGIDRDSDILASEFDERDASVMKAMFHVIDACRRNGVTSSICGQAPSTYPEITEALVRNEITSVSVNPDAVMHTRRLIASTEQRMILELLENIREGGRGFEDMRDMRSQIQVARGSTRGDIAV